MVFRKKDVRCLAILVIFLALAIQVPYLLSHYQPGVFLQIGSPNLSKRWKVWGIIEKNVVVEPGASFFTAWKLTVPDLEGWISVKVDSIFIKVLNGRSESGEGEVWLEYWLYSGCDSSDQPGSCGLSAKMASHVFYLKPDGLVSDLIDIQEAIKADGSIYILEIRNISKLTARFGSIEYLFVFCRANLPGGGSCIE